MKHGVLLSSLVVLALACSSKNDNDQPDPTPHNALGDGNRLRDVQSPSGPEHPSTGSANVNVTSVVVTAIDTFDETQNGKSRGTIFVQDVDQAGPYAGISLYSPTFIPGNLRLAPGDVINMTGQYVEQGTIGSTVNFAPAFLPQMSKPQVSLAYETRYPTPTVIQLADIAQFTTGRQWIGMLVTIQDVTVIGAPTSSGSGRVAAAITNTTNGPEINNELWDLQVWNGSNTSSSFAPGTHFKSVTGIVDFFFNIFIAPRSIDDLVQ